MKVAALPAASLLLVRDGAAGLEVLTLTRSGGMAFAGGMLVFPGGRVDAADRHIAGRRNIVRGTGLSLEGRAHRLAALRELFEETGLLVASAGDCRRALCERERVACARRYRRRMQAGRIAMAHMLERCGLRCDLGMLVPFAHWVTPAPAPRRFDTRFYLCRAPSAQRASPDGIETVCLAWHRPRDLLAARKGGAPPLMLPTRLNLMKLARVDTVAEALALARRTMVVPLTPQLAPDGTLRLHIPLAAGFGLTEVSEPWLYQPRQTTR